MTMENDISKISITLDKLTLDALTLMEQEIQMKLNVENAMCAGELGLAKARYVMGQNCVTSLQLPTENCAKFDAVMTVNTEQYDEKMFGQKSFEMVKTNNSETIQNPIKWFGYLVPNNLNHAQCMYRQALQWIVKTANVQTQLMETCKKIVQLKDMKKEKLL